MTNREFSDAFTTMLNSYNTQAQFGEQASKMGIVLDEYEKSVLLTQAQDLIVKSYFDGTLNPQGQGFDDSTRRQVDFGSLTTMADLTPFTGTTLKPFDDRGVLFEVPSNVLYVLNEQLVVITTIEGPADQRLSTTQQSFVVVPISFKEYNREMSKPYAQPLKRQAWRLLQNKGNSNCDMVAELIPKANIIPIGNGSTVGDVVFVYKMRFIRRPQPIILENLPNGLEIDGISQTTPCELNPSIHRDILNKAVELALATRGGSYQQFTEGKRVTDRR